MENRDNYNRVVNWNLKCFGVREVKGGVILNCVLNGKKNPDGTYPKGMNLSVYCNFQKCRIAEDDYTNAYITVVSGGISVGEWTKQDGTKVPQYTIFADEVVKRVFNN